MSIVQVNFTSFPFQTVPQHIQFYDVNTIITAVSLENSSTGWKSQILQRFVVYRVHIPIMTVTKFSIALLLVTQFVSSAFSIIVYYAER